MTPSVLTRLQQVRAEHARRRTLWRELSSYTTAGDLNDIEAAIARSGDAESDAQTQEIRRFREQNPGITVLAHPECPPEVVAQADFTGSTAAMADYVSTRKPTRVVLLTECSMSDNVAVQNPDVEFIRPCNLCPHMKRITLANIRRALETNTHIVNVDPVIATRARRAVERMLAV